MRHDIDGDLEKPARHNCGRHGLSGLFPNLLGHHLKGVSHGHVIERFIAILSENGGKILGLDSPEHDVAIGDSQGTTAPVAFRSGESTCRLGANPEALTVKSENRPPACRHSMD